MTNAAGGKRILITGATGFVGGAAAARLGRRSDMSVERLGRRWSGAGAGLSADVRDRTGLLAAVARRRFDVVVHAAGLAHRFGATSRDAFREVNVEGTANVCRAAAECGARRLVLISSVSVYGPHGGVPVDEGFECRPEGDYAVSKLEAEQAAVGLCAANGIELSVLRLATVVGPGDPGNVARLIGVIRGGRFFWVGDGSNRKTLVPVSVVAQAVESVCAAGPGESAGIFNIALPPLTTAEIVATIAGAVGRKVPRPLFGRGIGRAAAAIGHIPGFGGIAAPVRKWLADDLYSGETFFRDFGVQPSESVGEALASEALSLNRGNNSDK